MQNKPCNNKILKNEVTNDKIVFVENCDFEDLKNIIEQFCLRYKQNNSNILALLSRISENKFIITFPYDVDFEIYCYFINYLYYPIKVRNYNPIIKAWTTTKSSDKWITENIPNKLVMLYIPPNDKEYDNVYIITADNDVFKINFAKGKISPVLSEFISYFVKPIEIRNYNVIDKIQLN